MNQMTPTKAAGTAVARTGANPVSWLRNEIDRLFDDFGGANRSIFDFGSRVFAAPSPAIEMKEGARDYQLTAELPGMAEDDVTIDVADDLLTISGEKRETEERKDDGYIVSERRYGSFERRIPIPTDVDAAKIKAKFAKGVLTVTLPKDEKAPARSRKVAIEH
jgi:HSP20 family protein